MISWPVARSAVPFPHTEMVFTHANSGDAVCRSVFSRISRSPVVSLGSPVPTALIAIRVPSTAPTDIVQSNRREVAVGALPLAPWEMMSVAHTPEAEQGLASNQQRLGLTDEHMEALRYDAVPRGLPASDMDAEGRERLEGLVRLYVDRLPEQLAAIEWAKLERAGIDGIHFAWAGGDQHRQPHYYRLQGPSLLVEYDNTQDGANHIHSVWRDPGNDFGADLLRRHYAAAH